MNRTTRNAPALFAALLAATLGLGATIHLGPGGGPAEGPPTLFGSGSGPVGIGGRLDRSAIREGEHEVVSLELLLDAPQTSDAAVRGVPTDLVVVLDRSGSMAGDKIVHARASIRALVDLLGSDDRFALVSYAHGARLDIPLAAASGGTHQRWLERIEAVAPAGGTNMAAGLDHGLALLEGSRGVGRAARLVLISDGLANQGDTSPEGLRARASRAVRGEFALSTVGVGLEFDEQLLGTLARAGTGNYHYVESSIGLQGVFAGEFLAARETAASGLLVEIAPGPGVQVETADSYPLERDDGVVRFRPGPLFAGQHRSVWVSLRVEPGSGEVRLGEFALHYRNGVDGSRHTARLAPAPRVARVADEEEYLAGFDTGVWSRAVTDGALNRLRRSVAESVRGGRKDEAKEKLEAYKAANAPMAQRLRAPEVAAELRNLDALEAEVDDAFTGADQKKKQSRVSKQLHSLGYVE